MKIFYRVLFFLLSQSAAVHRHRTAKPGRTQGEALVGVDSRTKLVQEIVDSLFSFSELGFQEFETQRYLGAILRANGFTVENGVADIPSAWWASGQRRTGHRAGLRCGRHSARLANAGGRLPPTLIEGAPGHGEGHNSGQAVNIAAALAIKDIMERENLPGTIVLGRESLKNCWAPRPGMPETAFLRTLTPCCLPRFNNLTVSWGQARAPAWFPSNICSTGCCP